jgi:hypothetical protein
MNHRRASIRILAVAATLSTGACLDADETASPTAIDAEFGVVEGDDRGRRGPFTVYTQNLYLGGDTGPLFSLDLNDPASLPALIAATAGFYADVLGSDIPGRSAEFVDEMQRRRPDVVGRQEAVGYIEGELNLVTGDFTPTGIGPDLFSAVMAEIDARNLPYEVAVEQPTTLIALPVGPPDALGVAPAIAVQDRVVMLKHRDVSPSSVDQGTYIARLPLGPADIVRGWVGLTVERDGVPYHFYATHLETQGSDHPAAGPIANAIRMVHDGQAQQLQAMLLAKDGVTVLMGDLNSDAEAAPGAPSYTDTYGNLIAAGFVDAWDESRSSEGDSGYTCCHAKELEGPNELDERIDFVLVRSTVQAPAPGLGDADGEGTNGDGGVAAPSPFFRTSIVGEASRDRTDRGLWPSDHAGLVSSIRYFMPRN